MINVTVVLLSDNFASTAIGPVEVFYSAGALWQVLRGETPVPRFRVTTASLDGSGVSSPYALRLMPQGSIADIDRTDLVIVPASGLDFDQQFRRNASMFPWLRRMFAQGASIAGMCSGVAYLAEAGLLDGRQATTHWAVAEDLRRRFPAVDWRPEKFITDDRRVLCSGGVYGAVDLSMYLVEKLCGRETALQCARALLVNMPRANQSGYAVLPLSRPHEDAKIRGAEEYLEKNYAGEISFEALARRLSMSPRNFIRRFKAATGRLPGNYLQTLRIAIARELLEEGARSVQAVGGAVGYVDPAFFRALFKRCTGMTPQEYRENFAGMGVGRTDTPPRQPPGRRAA